MKRMYEYSIISGKTVETRRSLLTVRYQPKAARAPKTNTSSLAKSERNKSDAIKQLARIINCNFGTEDLFLTLKYDDAHLPADYGQLRNNAAAIIRQIRKECKKSGTSGQIKYIMASSNWSPKKNSPARLHHHLIISGVDSALVSRIWSKYGTVYVEALNGHGNNDGDYSNLAAYMIANVHTETPSQRRYTGSKGLDKPIYTEPVEVSSPESSLPDADAVIKDNYAVTDGDGRIIGSYLRYTLPYPPSVIDGVLQYGSRNSPQWDSYAVGFYPRLRNGSVYTQRQPV